MNAHIVTQGSYGDYKIIAVFSSAKKAIAFADDWNNKKEPFIDKFEHDTFVINEIPEEYKKQNALLCSDCGEVMEGIYFTIVNTEEKICNKCLKKRQEKSKESWENSLPR